MEIITGKLDHVRPRNDEIPVNLYDDQIQYRILGDKIMEW